MGGIFLFTEMTKKELYNKAMSLPLLPGVYIMRNRSAEVIYVGKAKRLKIRVSQYFREGTEHLPKVEKMVSNAFDFDVIVVDSEYEALTLECSLIKQHHPKYNILMMDDKGFSYIRISREKWPRITCELQKVEGDNARYIGPYINSYAVKKMCETANQVFMLPTCTSNWENHPRKRPCLNSHISLCCAPCTGNISLGDYLERVSNAEIMLTKGTGEIISVLEKRMNDASENLDFEKAAEIRDSIFSIRKVESGQKVVKEDSDSEMDVFAFAGNESSVCADVLKFRDGTLVDKEEKVFYDTSDVATVREEFLTHYYLGEREIPRQIIIDVKIEYQDELAKWLSDRRNGSVSIIIPKRGELSQISYMAYKNASDRLRRDSGRRNRTEETLGELANMLGLASYPKRIEMYDISNYGEDAVGGMTVFYDGVPRKSEYRKFRIKTVSGIDDYAFLSEVLSRRVERFNIGSPGFCNKPDLIFLDGGKGHLDTITALLKDTSFCDVPIFGLVKDDKHRTRAIVSTEGEIQVSMHKEIFVLISKMQDEVHRFTITYERTSHAGKQTKSSLTNIRGVGEVRAKLLIKKFKTITAISNASVDDLRQVGIDENTALSIWKYYHT